MPQDQLLLTILGLVVFANVVLVALIPLRTHSPRRLSRQDRVQSVREREPETVFARPPAAEPGGPRLAPPARREPRSDDDAAPIPRAAHCRIRLQIALRKIVVPAAERENRNVNFLYPLTRADGLPE